MKNRFLAILKATCRMLWHVVCVPYTFVCIFRSNRKYDKYYRKKYLHGKRTFNDDTHEVRIIADKDFVDLSKFYRHGT